MMSQGITTHILPNISWIKGNQTIKFGQLRKETFLFESHAENEAGKLVPERFLFFEKALYKVKASGRQLDFTIFR